MAEILQGTTPSLEIVIDTDDFLVSDVYKLELAMYHNGTLTTYDLDDVTTTTYPNVALTLQSQYGDIVKNELFDTQYEAEKTTEE